jgi:hypothetical protein
MTVHQCPKCELRFNWKTELDDHCWHDHPEFRHEYPAQVAPEPETEHPPVAGHGESVGGAPSKNVVEGFFGWLAPRRSGSQQRRSG